MKSEVKDFILRCETCRTYKRKQPKEPLIPHKVPMRPWAKVGIDIMTFETRNYLITVDYFSNFWETLLQQQ